MKFKKLAAALCAAVLSLTAVSFSAFAEDDVVNDTGVAIDETNFPDETFREIVKEFDTDEDGSLSAEEIAAVTEIDCSFQWIGSLEGIENFTALTYLDCGDNELTALDVSKNIKLESLYCYSNSLKELDVSKNTVLENLQCSGNQLTVLDLSKNTALIQLWCYDNQLTTLDVSECTALETLWCSDNQLTTLDVSKCTALETLQSGGNQLTELDISNNTALIQLRCDDNQLTILDVSQNIALTELYCHSNQLTKLDISNNFKLIDLFCYSNQLTELDLSKSTSLINLFCSDNQLNEIILNRCTGLCYLGCANNHLTELDISNNIELRYLYCQDNNIAELDISKNPCLITVYTEGRNGNEYYGEGFEYFFFVDETTKVITGAAKPEEKPATLTDEKTKVAVTGALDGLKLNVKPADVKDAVAAYDITLTDADNKVVQPSGKIEISIPCETKGLYVYHIKDDGTKEYIESKYVDGCYVFTADHLSVYALMKDKPVTTPEENKPSTGDTKPADDSNKPTGSAAGIAFAGIALAGAALMVSKKRK